MILLLRSGYRSRSCRVLSISLTGNLFTETSPPGGDDDDHDHVDDRDDDDNDESRQVYDMFNVDPGKMKTSQNKLPTLKLNPRLVCCNFATPVLSHGWTPVSAICLDFSLLYKSHILDFSTNLKCYG